MKNLSILLSLLFCSTLLAEANPQPSPGKLPKPIKENVFLGPRGQKTLSFFITRPMTIVASAKVGNRRHGRPTGKKSLVMSLRGPSKRLFKAKRGDFPITGLSYDITERLGNQEFKHGTRWKLTFANQSKRNFAGLITVQFYELGAKPNSTLGQGQKPIRARYVLKERAKRDFAIKVDTYAEIKATVKGHKKSSVVLEILNPRGQVMTSRDSGGTFTLKYEVSKEQVQPGRKWTVRVRNPSKRKGRLGTIHIVVLRKRTGPLPEQATKMERIMLRGKKSKTLPLKIKGARTVHFKGQHPRNSRDRGGEKPRKIQLIGPKGKVHAEHIGKLPLQFTFRVTNALAARGNNWKLLLTNPSKRTTTTLVFYGARGEANPQPSP